MIKGKRGQLNLTSNNKTPEQVLVELKNQLQLIYDLYSKFPYPDLGVKRLGEVYHMTEDYVKEIINALEPIPNMLNQLNNSKQLRETYLMNYKAELRAELNIQIDNSISIINKNTSYAYPRIFPLIQTLENIRIFLKDIINKISECFIFCTENSITLNNRDLPVKLLKLQQELEDQDKILSTLIDLIKSIILPFCTKASEAGNPRNYKEIILLEDKAIPSRIKMVLTNLKEKIIKSELRDQMISSIKEVSDIIKLVEKLQKIQRRVDDSGRLAA